MLRIQEIFEQFAEAVEPDLQRVAGSHFGKTINYEATEKGLVIDGDKHIGVMVYGRGRTKNRQRSTPTLQQALLEWIKNKGIIARATKNGKIPTAEQLSWAMSKVIHERGTILYRSSNKNWIFDNVITRSRIDNLLNMIGEEYEVYIESKLLRNGTN